MKIQVNTPFGVRNHGEIKGDNYIRKVKEKDKMKIFNAWSINPQALDKIIELKVKKVVFLCDNVEYSLPLEEVLRVGFSRTFKGGETFYIPIKHFEVKNNNQPHLILDIDK